MRQEWNSVKKPIKKKDISFSQRGVKKSQVSHQRVNVRMTSAFSTAALGDGCPLSDTLRIQKETTSSMKVFTQSKC